MYNKKRFCGLKCAGAIVGEGKRKQTSNYYTLHWRVRQARGAAKEYPCEHCGKLARDWAMLHGTDGQNPEEYIPLCRRCHIAYDEQTQKAVATKREQGSFAWTETQRQRASAAQKARAAQLTHEQRSESTLKGWITRRQNAEENAHASIVE